MGSLLNGVNDVAAVYNGVISHLGECVAVKGADKPPPRQADGPPMEWRNELFLEFPLSITRHNMRRLPSESSSCLRRDQKEPPLAR